MELAYSLNTLYFLLSGVLVMWMAAGFTMLEAGSVRSKNVIEILLKNVALYSVASLGFLLGGYSLMYGWGDIATHSIYSDFFFQVVFAATAMSVVSGAVAERKKLWTFLLFAALFSTFIYPIQGAWSWGGGWLSERGFFDFAGSGIVHMAGAAAALAGVLILGPRKGKYLPDGTPRPIHGSNAPLVALGTLILWMGWFGFNGGSQLAIDGIVNADAVAKIFVNTNTAAAAGLIAAMILSKLWLGKTALNATTNGALAGLVVITADPLTPSPEIAILYGALGGLLVPLNGKDLVIDLIEELDCEAVVVSQNYLGSINHTLLTISVLKERSIPITGIVFNGDANKETENIILEITGVKCLGRLNQEKEITPSIIAKYATQFKDI